MGRSQEPSESRSAPSPLSIEGPPCSSKKDAAAHRAVIRAEGKDSKGQGNVGATITVTLDPAADGTHVLINTDLTVTGKVAQFGRAVINDVSRRLLGQFVENLQTTVLDDALRTHIAQPVAQPASSAAASKSEAPGGDRQPREAASGHGAAPIDGLSLLMKPALSRVGPVVALLAFLAVLHARRKRAR